MHWLILWAPIGELLFGFLFYAKFAEKMKDIGMMMIVQIVLYVVLMNGLLLFGYFHH